MNYFSVTYSLLFASGVAFCAPFDVVPLESLRSIAEQGDPQAQFQLGMHYYRGKEIARDYIEAAKWLMKSANQGNADAQLRIGLCYSAGEGVEKDFTKAAGWYRKAAEQGNPSAQLGLAVRYYRGEGVEQDYTEAVKWFMKSAEQGNATAQGAEVLGPECRAGAHRPDYCRRRCVPPAHCGRDGSLGLG